MKWSVVCWCAVQKLPLAHYVAACIRITILTLAETQHIAFYYNNSIAW